MSLTAVGAADFEPEDGTSGLTEVNLINLLHFDGFKSKFTQNAGDYSSTHHEPFICKGVQFSYGSSDKDLEHSLDFPATIID